MLHKMVRYVCVAAKLSAGRISTDSGLSIYVTAAHCTVCLQVSNNFGIVKVERLVLSARL